jgi:hypothetical protein
MLPPLLFLFPPLFFLLPLHFRLPFCLRFRFSPGFRCLLLSSLFLSAVLLLFLSRSFLLPSVVIDKRILKRLWQEIEGVKRNFIQYQSPPHSPPNQPSCPPRWAKYCPPSFANVRKEDFSPTSAKNKRHLPIYLPICQEYPPPHLPGYSLGQE